MGWKVRSDKLESVKAKADKIGKKPQVRWEVTKYRIQKALETGGKTLEAGLNLEDIEYLTNAVPLIGNLAELMTEMIKKLGKKEFSLEEIRDYFLSHYKGGITNLMDGELNIKDNDSVTYERFFKGRTAIKYDTFKTISTVLGYLDCNEIGTDESEMPNPKKLETLLWQLNHQNQIAEFQNLAQKSSNLVCLRFRTFSDKDIRVYWLLKALLQPIDRTIEQTQIDFNSRAHSNLQQRLNAIITGLSLSESLKNKQKYDRIAQAICKKMQKGNKTIVLLFYTQEWQQLKQSEELLNILQASLQKELQRLEIQEQQKILIISIDSQTSSRDESEAFDFPDDRDIAIPQLDLISEFTNNDIIEWTQRESVNKFIKRITDRDLNYISEFIWNQSQGRSEDLLKSVYSLCKLDWEEHQDLWQNL
jgi:hypothetical protein